MSHEDMIDDPVFFICPFQETGISFLRHSRLLLSRISLLPRVIPDIRNRESIPPRVIPDIRNRESIWSFLQDGSPLPTGGDDKIAGALRGCQKDKEPCGDNDWWYYFRI